tara:strand:- start:246 stop:965 length:720 start_codon:yes stop_codon:yes gene_type:complete
VKKMINNEWFNTLKDEGNSSPRTRLGGNRSPRTRLGENRERTRLGENRERTRLGGNSPKSNEKVEKVLPAFAVGAARAGMAAAKTPAGQAAIGAAGNFAKDKLQERVAQQKKDLEEQKRLMTEQTRLTAEQENLSKKLVGSQKKLDKNKNGKLDEEDFKQLRVKKMSEDKGVRELERELKEARIREKTTADSRIEKNRDFTVGAGDPNMGFKPRPNSDGIPNVILLPKKNKKQSENIPF